MEQGEKKEAENVEEGEVEEDRLTMIGGKDILEHVTAKNDIEEDRPVAREKFFFPLEMDVYQASLYFATTDDSVDSALFRTLASVKARAKRLRSRSSASSGTSQDIDEAYREDDEGWSKAHFHRVASWYARHRILLFVSIVFVLQATLMHQFLYSVTNRSCNVSTECVRGTSCSQSPRAPRSNACAECLPMRKNESTRIESLCFEIYDSYELLRKYSDNDAPDVRVSYEDSIFLDKAHSTLYSSRVFLELCAGCVQDDGRWHDLKGVERETILAMTTADFFSLVVCAMAVALTVVGEIRETKIAVIAQKKIYRKTRARTAGHVWFGVLVALRIYLFVPQIMSTVPQLVLRQGGNAVDLVFNTVAVVFIVEIDNLLGQLLSAPTLHRLRRVAVVNAPKTDHKYLSVMQKIYSVVIIMVIFLCLFISRSLSLVLCLGVVYVIEGADVVLSEDKPHLMRVIFASNSCMCTDCCRCLCGCCRRHKHGKKKKRGCCCACCRKGDMNSNNDEDDDEDAWRMAFVPEVRVPRRNEAWRPCLLGADLFWYNFEFFVLIVLPSAVLLNWTLAF